MIDTRRLGLGISLLLVLGATAASRAQPAPRIPLKDFFDNPKISSAAISPDGRQLAFLAPEGNRMNVWVGDDQQDLGSAKAITHDKRRGIMHFVWTRDSRYVLFEQDRDGDENFHLFRADPLHSDADPVDLTPMGGVLGPRSSIFRAVGPKRPLSRSMAGTSATSMRTASI
jgi:hypothetical protein